MRNYLQSLVLLFVFFWVGNAFSQSTTGTLTVSFTSTATGVAGAQTTTKHIEAIWVDNSSGTYIHTISYKAATRKQYLTIYNAITGTSTASTSSPTSTGATISNGAESYTWNSLDNSGAALADGVYNILFQSCDGNNPGVNYSYAWTKGATATTTTSPSYPGFGVVTFKWVPTPVCTPPTVIIAAPNATVCSGSPTILTASGATAYAWSNGASTAAITVSPTTTTTYIVSGTTTGCTGTASQVVTVNAKPTVALTPSAAICSGSNKTLTASGATTYIWNNGLAAGTSNSVTPTITTVYSVTGTSNGCSGTASTTVTVNAVPTITLTPSATVCQGVSTLLTATGAISYVWNNGLAAGASNSVSPLTTTTYFVTGTTSGCSGTALSIITVNTSPTITLTPSATVCNGVSSTLTASGATSYIWNNGLATVASNSVTPTITTVYSVTGTSNGCSGTASSTVTVIAVPTITLTPSATVCQGVSTSLTATGATSYVWNNGLAAITSNNVSPTATTIYSVTGTSNGCIGTASSTVTVNALPTIVASANPTAVCSGSTTSLSGTGGTNYTWSNGLTGSLVIATPSANTTYVVTGSNVNGCKSTSSIAITYTNTPLPIGSDASITIGGTVPTLSATGTTIKWYDAAGTTVLSTGSTYKPSVSTASATQFPYKVSNTVNGCESAQITITLIVTNCTVTVPSVSIPTQAKCAGVAFTAFTATGTTIKWYASDQTTLLSTGASYIPTSAGDYYATQTIGCEGPKTKVTATVNPLPAISIQVSNKTICNGNQTTLTASGASSYSWSNGNATVSINVTPTLSTTYTVTGIVNSCSSTASQAIIVNQLTTSTITTSATTSYSLNGTVYSSSGTYTQSVTNIAGCDSIITLNLTIKQATDFSVLTSTIANAQKIYNAAIEGTGNGQYPTGSKAILQTAIDAATLVNANTNATQVQVDGAVLTLNTDITTFQGKVLGVNKSTLVSAISSAQTIYSGANEGTGNGMYPKGSKATLQTAIDAATLVNSDVNASQPTVDGAVSTLNTAVATFQGSQIIVIKTALVSAISTAQTVYSGATEGTGNGMYPSGSKATLQSAIDAATLVNSDANASQSTIDGAVSTLNTSVATFQGLQIIVTKSALASAITSAQSVYSSATEGTGNGQYPVGSKATLQTAINAASTVNSNPNASQVQVNTAISNLNNAVTAFSNSQIGVKKAALVSAISSAQTVYSDATEGTGNGMYPTGSKATLQSAIDAASTVNNDANAIQAQVDKAKIDLQAAVTTFQSLQIVVSKTALASGISSAQTVYSGTTEGTGNGMYPTGSKTTLQSAIDAATIVNTDANSSQAQVDKSKTDLQAAVTTFQGLQIVVSKTDLASTITSAQTVYSVTTEGTGNGMYPTGSKATLQSAMDAAANVNTDVNASQAQVDKAKTDLQAAITTFQGLIIVVDKTALAIAISSAQTVSSGATEGTASGQYPIGSKATLQSAIDAATTINADANASQTQVDKAKTDLQAAVTTFQAGVIAIVTDKSALQSKISDALSLQTTVLSIGVGSLPTEYPTLVYTAFTTELTIAQTIVNNNLATQTQINSEVTALQNAVIALTASVNPKANKAALETIIKSADSLFVVINGSTDYTSTVVNKLISDIANAKNIELNVKSAQAVVDAQVQLLQSDILLISNSVSIQFLTDLHDVSATPGSKILLSVDVKPSSATFQWQVNTGSGFFIAIPLTSTNYSGINSNTLRIKSADVSLNGYQYRCVAKVGTQTGISATATLSVGLTAVSEYGDFNTYIYPTIATESINIVTNTMLAGQSLSIIDSKGVVQLRAKILGNETTVSLSKLSAGMYILTFPSTNEKSITFIKQ